MIIRLFTIFLLGSILGWILEILYRSLQEKKLVNPGFLNGPYLPIYGSGLVILFFTAKINLNPILIILVMTIFMSSLEFITGYLFEKYYKLKLWDYSKERFNLYGYISLKFSIYWGILGTTYYLFIHPLIENILVFLTSSEVSNLLIGIIIGIFLIDSFQTHHIVIRIRKIIIKLQETPIIQVPSFAKIKELISAYEKVEHKSFLQWFFIPFLYILNNDQIQEIRKIIKKQIHSVTEFIEDIADDGKLNKSPIQKNSKNENKKDQKNK